MPVVRDGRPRCAIVGAGVSGLPSARWAKAYGFEPVVFEIRDNIGGLWYFQEQETEFSCVMRKTIMNTSKEMSAFSDFPPPDDTPMFMTNQRMHQYLCDYADHHDLYKHIRLNHRVLNIWRAADFAESGEWTVEFRDSNQNVITETFQCVLLCTGRQSVPVMPKPYPGQESFQGKIIHSKQYKDANEFAGQKVLVVGLGNSGTDAASEVGQVASRCFLSTNRGAWIVHRTLQGVPNDCYSNRRIMLHMRRLVGPRLFAWFMENRVYRRCFDHRVFGLEPQHRYYNQNPILICDELQLRLAAGQVHVKPAIRAFKPRGVEFADGSSEAVDAVVFCTGFSYSFRFLEQGKLLPDEADLAEDADPLLWKNMIPLKLVGQSRRGCTLAVIGMLQLSGAIMTAMEMQARVFFALNTGQARLPGRQRMLAEARAAWAESRARYLNARAHHTKVGYLEYMGELARLLGCRASAARLCWTDPRLAYRLLLHPDLPYAYRLVGPHAWPGARRAICDLDRRMRHPLQGQRRAARPLRSRAALALLLGLLCALAWGARAMLG